MTPRSDERGGKDQLLPGEDPQPGRPVADTRAPAGAPDDDVPDLRSPEPEPAEPLAMPPDATGAGAPEDAADPVVDAEPRPFDRAHAEPGASDAQDAPAQAETRFEPPFRDEAGVEAPADERLEARTREENRFGTPASQGAAAEADADAGSEARLASEPAPSSEAGLAEATPRETGAPREAHEHREPAGVSSLTPPPATAAREAEEPEYHEPEEGSSLAAKVLTALVLLLAGAALGIWAAPKLAPALPSGLAPVAAWLTPGAREAEARVAALEARLDAALAETAARIDGLVARPELAGAIDEAVSASASRLDAEIASLRESLASSDPAALGQRIAQLQSALDGQRGELATLKEQLSGGAAVTAAQGDEAAARIDVYQAELDGLRAEVGRLSGEVGSLGGRVEEVAAIADRSISAAEARVQEIEAEAGARTDAAQVNADVAGIRAALAAGLPFATEAERLQSTGAVTLPEGLAAAAETGAPTLAALRDGFPDAAHAAIEAAILASSGDGFFARARAYAHAQVASRSLTPRPGDAPDAVLSRMEDRLRTGDLAGVLTEADSLPSEAATAMDAWLDGVRARQAADAALATLGSSLPAAD